MLREGWDVPEVGVILLLRKFSSKVYGQQVIGRGLRRVRKKGVTADEPQICAVVDHPKLEHQWLWDIFGTKPRENVAIDDEFDETTDLPPPPPRQEIVRPENIIEVPRPDEGILDDEPFDLGEIEGPAEPIRNWREVLASFEYDPTAVEITKVGIAGVYSKELAGEGWKELHSAPDLPTDSTVRVEFTDDQTRSAVKEQLLEMSEQLAIEAGYAASFKGTVYSALLEHVKEKFLGTSLGLAERGQLDFAWKMLPKVKAKMHQHPGLVAGMIEYGPE
jgi:superfamily II DNA or RNA helicase